MATKSNAVPWCETFAMWMKLCTIQFSIWHSWRPNASAKKHVTHEHSVEWIWHPPIKLAFWWTSLLCPLCILIVLSSKDLDPLQKQLPYLLKACHRLLLLLFNSMFNTWEKNVVISRTNSLWLSSAVAIHKLIGSSGGGEIYLRRECVSLECLSYTLYYRWAFGLTLYVFVKQGLLLWGCMG